MSKGRQVAIKLMRMALALLDREDEPMAALRLQQAIDSIGQYGESSTDAAGCFDRR